MSERIGPCFRCGKFGHLVAECDEMRPAASKDEHLARLDQYVQRMIDGQWTPREKQLAIAAENRMWYGDKRPEISHV